MRTGLTAMIRKEFRQIFRDGRTLGMLLAVPLGLLVIFGYAINMDVQTVRVGILDRDGTPESRRTAELFAALDFFAPPVALRDASQGDLYLEEGRIDAVVELPPDFGRGLSGGTDPVVRVSVDGSNVTRASTTQAYVEAALTDLPARVAVDQRRSAPDSRTARQEPLRVRTWFNPELESSKFLVPGLVSFIMVITAVISTALSVVREKEKGTMEMLRSSPLGPLAIVLGKTVPYMALSLTVTALILAAGRVLFGVRITGNPLALLLVTFLFILSCLGMGLMISASAKSQQTAFLLSTVVTVLPSFILSGFVFPIRNMPAVIQAVTRIIPARYFLSAERALILRGASFAEIWRDAGAMAVFSAVTLAISWVRLSREEAF